MADKQKAQSGGISSLSRAYLILYNAIQIYGWSRLLVGIMLHFLTHPDVHGLYASVEDDLKIFQTAAVLEVIHCAIGIVPSSAVLTFLQVFSRVFLTWGVVHSVKQSHNQIGVAMFLCAWSITEVIRYSFYALSLIKAVPYLLLWCRYTFFIILYPIGVTGELLTIYAALPVVRKSGLYTVSLPNTANISFNYFYFLIIIMLSYIPVFPQLYGHMVKQRKKIIGGEKSKTA